MNSPSEPGASASSRAGSSPAGESGGSELGYALWAVLRRPSGRNTADEPSGTVEGQLSRAIADVEAEGVVVRGIYDVSGLRADADVLIWLHGERPEVLQAALRTLRRATPLVSLDPTWNALGVHRMAEFSRDHAPAFLKGLPPKRWVTVYPFVRSYDWYLLDENERRQMLRDHGIKGSEYPQVQANTVSSFALGDYEWILALEADELVDLVDLMRHLRNTEARRHVREEVPFFTGRLIGLDELAEVLA